MVETPNHRYTVVSVNHFLEALLYIYIPPVYSYYCNSSFVANVALNKKIELLL